MPAELGLGPSGYWFFGALTNNRGAVPHFALEFDLAAVIDRQWLDEHPNAVPAQYRGAASRVTELRISPSIFIPSTLYISPPIQPLGGTGLFGVTWKPLGLTLVGTSRGSREHRALLHAALDAHLLLTYLFIFNTSGLAIPTTHFVRPGLELKAMLEFTLSERVSLGLGANAQLYLPQRLGSFFEFGPLNEAVWLAVGAVAQVRVRFLYELSR